MESRDPELCIDQEPQICHIYCTLCVKEIKQKQRRSTSALLRIQLSVPLKAPAVSFADSFPTVSLILLSMLQNKCSSLPEDYDNRIPNESHIHPEELYELRIENKIFS